MLCSIALFIVILTTGKVTSSDQRLSGSTSGDDVTLPHHATTLQYCYIDNCTIMRIDTGEELDITYTTDSLLVATPITDGHTSMIITRLDDELSCELLGIALAIFWASALLLFLMNGCVIVVHLMIKDLRNPFGKLLMLRSCGTMWTTAAYATRLTISFLGIERLQMVCHFLTVSLVVSTISSEALATCMLHLLANIVYHSSKLQRISKEEMKVQFRNYIRFVLGSTFLVFVLMISYDVGIHQGAYVATISCNPANKVVDDVASITTTIHKSVQITLFAGYLYYKYQLNKDVQDPDILRSQEKALHRIGVVMGATIGIVQLLYLVYLIFQFHVAFFFAWLVAFIQQIVIVQTLLCTKNTRKLCKERFSKN